MVEGGVKTSGKHFTERSSDLFARAQNIFPGGVNSPVRAFQGVGGEPRFLDRGTGPYVVDADGNRLIDYVLSYGPLILGHAHPKIIRTISKALTNGTSFGAPNRLSLELAERITAAMPSVEMIRFVNSGTEATMSAIRLARAFTGRSRILKFEGCYHGHSDHLLVRAGSGVATLGLPDSPGVPPSSVEDTLVAHYNNLESVEQAFSLYASDLACVIVEPVAGNMGVVPPIDGFLHGLRRICYDAGALLIFDEVMTGFRVAPGGAQERYGVKPDLTTLGKVIGGGLPVGAFGGRKEIMRMLAPSGPVYQAGTLSGNPVAMAAGISTLDLLLEDAIWHELEMSAGLLEEGAKAAAREAGVGVSYQRVGTMSSMFFSDRPVVDWETARSCNTTAYASFFHRMLQGGCHLAPSPFEAMFLSTEHDVTIIRDTIHAIRQALS